MTESFEVRLEREAKSCPKCNGKGATYQVSDDSMAAQTCICQLRIRVLAIVGEKVYSAGPSTSDAPHLSGLKSYCIRGANWKVDCCPRLKMAALRAAFAGSFTKPYHYITDLDIKRSSLRGKEDIDQDIPLPSIDSLMRRQGLMVLRLGFCGVAPASLGDHVADAVAIRGDLPLWIIDSPNKKTTPLLEDRLSEMDVVDFTPRPFHADV